jgi:hypothetical protein
LPDQLETLTFQARLPAGARATLRELFPLVTGLALPDSPAATRRLEVSDASRFERDGWIAQEASAVTISRSWEGRIQRADGGPVAAFLAQDGFTARESRVLSVTLVGARSACDEPLGRILGWLDERRGELC